MRHLLFFFTFCPFLLQAQKDSLTNTLDAAVCTAVVNPTSVRNAVYPVKVIDEKVIQQRAANNLEELLAGETNFRLKSDLIIGSGLQIGGIGGENIKILVDGVPVIGRLNGNIDLSQIPLYNVKQVEIIQGSLSAIYGSNSAGGVINIITKKSQIKAFEAKINSLVESVNIQNHSLNLGYRYKKLLVQTGAAFYQFAGLPGDTLRAVSWKPKQQLSSNTTFKYYIDDAQQLTYTYNIFKEQLDNLGEIKLPTKEYAYAFDDYYYTTRSDQNLNYQGSWRKFHLQSMLGFNHFYRLKEAYQTRIKQGTSTLLEMGQDTSTFAGLLSRTVASYQYSSKLNFQSGIEAYQESTNSLKIVDSSQQNNHFSNIADYAFFALAKIQLFNNQLVTLQPALRIAYNTKFKAPLMPSLNVLLRPSENWTIRASYAKGFRAPSLKELYFNFIDINHYVIGNQNIKAESTDNFILSPSYTVQNENRMWAIETQLFYNHIKDRITLARYDVANLKYTYFNVGNFKTKGINTSITYKEGSSLTLKGSFAYTGFYNSLRDKNPTLPTYIYSPEASAEANYTLPGTSLTINVLYRYLGALPNFNYDIISDSIGEGLISEYQLLNATITQSFWNNKLQIAVGGKNLFNVKNVNQTGNLGVGHGATGSSVPVNFGSSVFIKASVAL